jgi:RND superfamily putative drug exporter
VTVRRLGRFVLRRRRLILVAAVAFLPLAAVVGGNVKEHLSAGGFTDPSSESARAARLLESRFKTGAPNLVVLVTARRGTGGVPPTGAAGAATNSPGASVDDPAVEAAGLDLARRLAAEPGVRGVKSYWQLLHAPPLRSQDGRSALILGQVPGDEDAVRDTTKGFAARYHVTTGPITAELGGPGEVFRQIEDQAQRDLRRAERLSLPLTLLLLVLVFGSGVAAGLPLAVGALAVVGTFLVLRVITALTDVSIFALNLTTAMGLGLAIDYSLFIVSRYREELRAGYEPDRAVLRAMQTAGRTVAFSALTVAVSLGALLVFPLPFLRSFAYAGVGVVATAAAGALVVLPALLAVLGRRIDRLALFHPRPKAVEDGFWYRRARAVMRRPVTVVVVVTAVLVLLGVPFVHLDAGLADDRVLAPGASVRRVGDAIRAGFSSKEGAALAVVSRAEFDAGAPGRGDEIDRYAKALSALPGVARVDAATGFYLFGSSLLGPGELSRRFVAPGRGTWLSVVPSVEPLSPAGERLVRAVRRTPAPFPVIVGGDSARLVDGKAALARRLPLALALVAVSTFVLLFLMVGSLLVPVKALALNVLSLSATFGSLVFVFQEGHFARALHFTPTGTISVFTPVLLFCIAFGLSMDYEVFLLSRIKEEVDLGHDNDDAVAVGLERTGRIVTAAALLLAVVFVAFATAQVSVVKVFGVGLALAVLVDAFLIRATLVPAFMRLAGRANWYAPRSLRRFHLRYGIWETEPIEISPSSSDPSWPSLPGSSADSHPVHS